MTYKKRPRNKQSIPSTKKRKKKAAPKRRSRVDKPFNEGTWTKSMFFQFIRRLLRRGSMYWKPIHSVRNEARIPYTGTNKKRKWSFVCSECNGEFDSKSINVHHKVECGELNSFEDVGGFIQRLFCEKDGLAVICKKCHKKLHS